MRHFLHDANYAKLYWNSPKMNIIETKIKGLLILEPRVFGDDRGWFMESFNQKTLSRL